MYIPWIPFCVSGGPQFIWGVRDRAKMAREWILGQHQSLNPNQNKQCLILILVVIIVVILIIIVIMTIIVIIMFIVINSIIITCRCIIHTEAQPRQPTIRSVSRCTCASTHSMYGCTRGYSNASVHNMYAVSTRCIRACMVASMWTFTVYACLRACACLYYTCVFMHAASLHLQPFLAVQLAKPTCIDNILWYGMSWHDMTWHDMTWHDMTWSTTTIYDMIARYGLTWRVCYAIRRYHETWYNMT